MCAPFDGRFCGTKRATKNGPIRINYSWRRAVRNEIIIGYSCVSLPNRLVNSLGLGYNLWTEVPFAPWRMKYAGSWWCARLVEARWPSAPSVKQYSYISMSSLFLTLCTSKIERRKILSFSTRIYFEYSKMIQGTCRIMKTTLNVLRCTSRYFFIM